MLIEGFKSLYINRLSKWVKREFKAALWPVCKE
jgi:hypothetical protein